MVILWVVSCWIVFFMIEGFFIMDDLVVIDYGLFEIFMVWYGERYVINRFCYEYEDVLFLY